MPDDPAQIASYLAQEHSLEKAIRVATEGILAAQDSRDFYNLSIWREVRRILRERE